MSDEEVLDEETTSEEGEEEVSEELPEASEEEEEYTVTLKDGTKKKFNQDVLDKIIEAHDKGEKWETKYHKKGEKLNKQQAELERKEKALAGIEKYVDEYKRFKTKVEGNPEAARYFNSLMASGKDSLDPAFKELAEKQNDLEREIAYDKAAIKLSKKYEDFDWEEIQDFVEEFDDENPDQKAEFLYFAWRGANIDEKRIKKDAEADVVRKSKGKKGLPSTGKIAKSPPKEPLTTQDARRLAHEVVNQRGEKWR
jgi:hypothetical protein